LFRARFVQFAFPRMVTIWQAVALKAKWRFGTCANWPMFELLVWATEPLR
jgi:hypothetical protein